MTTHLSHPLCKRLMDMGLEYLGDTYTVEHPEYPLVAAIVKENIKDKSDMGVFINSGFTFTPKFTIADVLTKENLIKVFGEKYALCDVCFAKNEKDCDCVGAGLINELDYHRNQLAAIYSTDGIQGVQRYLEDYLSRKER